MVLSIDEKTGMQAIERKHLDRPPRPGVIRRQEFEYVRHGTQALIAALDVHSGRTVAVCGDTRTQADLLAFMEQVAEAYPDQAVHVVWDNLNTHRSAKWVAFNEAHGGRFKFHFTPLHASWVNQIELLFGIFSKRVLRNASHTSSGHLKDRTLAWFSNRNQTPKPFKWSFRCHACVASIFRPANQRRLQGGNRMPKPGAALAASDVETKLRKILGHEAVTVKPYGRHFLIQMDDSGQPDTVARITQLDSRT